MLGALRACVRVGARRIATRRRLYGSDTTSALEGCKEFRIERHDVFFGYNDKNPVSEDNRLLLACAAPAGAKPNRGHALKLGVFGLEEGNYRQFGLTRTWCWQQGCMLRWSPREPNREAIFNDCEGASPVSRAVDIHTGRERKRWDRPLYDIDRNGTLAASLNFARLGRLRPGYGYEALQDATAGVAAPENDGLWLGRLSESRFELVLSTRRISSWEPQASMNDAEHYINHVTFSPNGETIAFIHLWGRERHRRGRMMLYQIANGGLRCMTNEEVVSHYDWSADDEIVAWARHENEEDGFFRYNIATGSRERPHGLSPSPDAHVRVLPDGMGLLFDGYPDEYGEQRVEWVDGAGCRRGIATFFAPPWLRGVRRCDLHARPVPGRKVVVDAAPLGRRRIYVLPLAARELRASATRRASD